MNKLSTDSSLSLANGGLCSTNSLEFSDFATILIEITTE